MTCIIRPLSLYISGFLSVQEHICDFGRVEIKLCTCHRLPRGGDPGPMWGNTGTLWGLCKQISSLVVGEMWGLRFLNALLSGKIWGLRLCSTERRLGTIFVRLIDGKMAEENKKVCFKIYCFLSIKQTIRQKFVRICRHRHL